MGTKVYVGNISYSTTEDALRGLFAGYGDVVSCRMITDRETGKFKGFAFVEMGSEDSASAAITALDGKDFDGRQLKVNEARDRNTGGGGGYAPRGRF